MQTMHLFAAMLFMLLGVSAQGADPGITSDTILIGQSAAMSGPAQLLGEEMRQGAKLYLDDLNRQGGVHGRKVELITLDDAHRPDRTVENTQVLINKKRVFALFGYVGTPTSQAALPIVAAAGIPFIAPYSGAQTLREPFSRYVFNVRASFLDETDKIVEQLITTGTQRFAVFYHDDDYGKAGLEGVEKALAKRGLKLVSSAGINRNPASIDTAVKTINATSPDAVVLIAAFKTAGAFIKGMKKGGSSTAILQYQLRRKPSAG